jgi:hypothetical protein
VSIISDEIDRVSDEITALRERHRDAMYPARGLLMAEIRDLMCERDRLREMNDKARQEAQL